MKFLTDCLNILRHLDWQAIATFVTGLLAVIAAILVGRKQIEITKNQSEILAGQLNLEHAKLRADLFERRMAVYEAAVEFLNETGNDRLGSPESNQRFSKFGQRTRESRFLFNEPEVTQKLKQMSDRSWEYLRDKQLQSCPDVIFDERRHENVGNFYPWISQALHDLALIMEPELSIAIKSSRQA
ncbi:hypothetical protein [Novosphingobium sp. 9]|uniref:hypothetical protein n=1 Tax=Novosphingobium sp. 9 TaxID=2025349 RepID=UPI0021B59502|nr:hypothetical protein [Novosphingobium sp. 9]